MTDRSDGAVSDRLASPEPYSPQRRTALVLTGTGTAGAYHAGVLRALHEAGVKIDIVAGRGIGVIGALFAAVDGAQRLWDEKGFWRADGVARLYEWRARPARRRLGARRCRWPSSPSRSRAVALGLVVFPIDFLLKMVGVGGAVGAGRRVPAVRGGGVRAGGAADVAAAAGAARAGRGRARGRRRRLARRPADSGARSLGAVWWRALRAPLSSAAARSITAGA